MEDRKKHKH